MKRADLIHHLEANGCAFEPVRGLFQSLSREGPAVAGDVRRESKATGELIHWKDF